MQVYEIGVRFMRRIQVKEYEPVEAETTLKAQLDEGEDAKVAVAAALALAAEQTHIALGLPASNKVSARKGSHSTATGTTVVADGKSKPEATKVTAGTPATADPTAPDPTAPAQATTQPTAVAAQPEAIPADFDLSAYVGGHVRGQRLTSEQVKALYPKYSVTRIADLKKEQVAAFKAEIDTMLKAAASANDL